MFAKKDANYRRYYRHFERRNNESDNELKKLSTIFISLIMFHY